MVDIDEISMFGVSGAPSSKLWVQRLKLNNPRTIAKDTSLLHKFYINHKLCKKILNFNNIHISYPIQQIIVKKYEEIDEIRVRWIKHAEKQCRKFHTGLIPWYPAETHVQLQIELWTLIVRRLRKCKVKTCTIPHKKKKQGLLEIHMLTWRKHVTVFNWVANNIEK